MESPIEIAKRNEKLREVNAKLRNRLDEVICSLDKHNVKVKKRTLEKKKTVIDGFTVTALTRQKRSRAELIRGLKLTINSDPPVKLAKRLEAKEEFDFDRESRQLTIQEKLEKIRQTSTEIRTLQERLIEQRKKKKTLDEVELMACDIICDYEAKKQ